jgi:hypothetical protein
MNVQPQAAKYSGCCIFVCACACLCVYVRSWIYNVIMCVCVRVQKDNMYIRIY